MQIEEMTTVSIFHPFFPLLLVHHPLIIPWHPPSPSLTQDQDRTMKQNKHKNIKRAKALLQNSGPKIPNARAINLSMNASSSSYTLPSYLFRHGWSIYPRHPVLLGAVSP
jgi:hypothetical protein